MKLSTKGQYGLRAVTYIAENGDKGYIPVSEIADQLSLSEKYLEQLIRLLKKDKIIESSRGAKGGYRLARDPKEISVGEILRSLEGELTSTDCVRADSPCDKSNCSAYAAFLKLDRVINESMNSISLEDVLVEK